ncbi:hypothetical protein CLOM_g10386 [Closterium sp. NIES-68]|nr:hypothetical protein CLOM_g10386 [Closterium sp. NIES-68]
MVCRACSLNLGSKIQMVWERRRFNFCPKYEFCEHFPIKAHALPNFVALFHQAVCHFFFAWLISAWSLEHAA